MIYLDLETPTYEMILDKVQKNQKANKKALFISNIVASPVFKNILEYEHINILNEAVAYDCLPFEEVVQTSFDFSNEDYSHAVIMFCVNSLIYETKSNKESVFSSLICTLKLIIYRIVTKYQDIPIFIFDPEDKDDRCYTEYVTRLRELYVGFANLYPSLSIVKMNKAVLWAGKSNFYNPQQEFMFRAPYSIQGMIAIARQLSITIVDFFGRYKKCIILDCDNVLWGNILDEVGKEGIQLNTSFPGNIFLSFQRNLLTLYESGVLLALCSKNEEKDVFEVLDNHPDMILRKEHFITWRINFNDKANNIKEICHELGIQTDSVVFIDDSIYEIDLVEKSLPGITALYAETSKISKLPLWITNSYLFKREGLTEEDTNRNQYYKQEKKRKLEIKNFVTYDEYLDSLNTYIDCKHVDEQSAARVSQLTQRTNRMNLSGRKYSQGEILSMIDDTDYWLMCIYLSDRLGDLGCVCAMIVKRTDNVFSIEGFYVSCRVIGRAVEEKAIQYFLSDCLTPNTNVVVRIKDNGKNAAFIKWIKEYLKEKRVEYGEIYA